jgi:hypothetical protein
MAVDSAPSGSSSEAGKATPWVASPTPPSWQWRRAALFLAGVAQLMVVTVAAIGKRVASGFAAVGAVVWDVARAGLPGEEIERRVLGNGRCYGPFMMRAKLGSRPSPQARLAAVALADQTGRALTAGTPASSIR